MAGEKTINYFFEQTARVENFENGIAVLTLSDGQKINWPIKKLPSGAKEGSLVRLVVFLTQDLENERKKIAKEILNKLLADSKP